MPRKSYRVKFLNGDGSAELAGIIDRPDPGSPGQSATCPVLVYSHCFTCNKDLKSTVRIARALSELGIAVLRFDMTGLGGSQGDFSRTNFSTNRADLVAAIRFAQQEIGPVTSLMGHSFGGAATLATAGELPSELETLGAVVTLAAPSDTIHLAKLMATMDPGIEREGTGQVTIGGVDWEIRKEMLDDFRQHDLPKLISKIACPALLIHSPVDATLSYDHAIRIMTFLQNSPDQQASVSLLTLSGADHLLTQNADDIKYVAEATAAFLHRYARSST